MRKLVGILTVLLYILILFAVGGCEKAKHAQAEAKKQEQINAGSIEPVHLGNGVYKFECAGARWENSLVKFKGENPELIITALSSHSRKSLHLDVHLVVTEKR